MAAPFEQAFDEFQQLQEEASKYTSESAPQGVKEGGETRAIHYREEEAIYVKASHDRVTVIFSTVFREETDRIFGKVFLQVFRAVSYLSRPLLKRRRNSLMPDEEPSRTHHRCCSETTPLSRFREFLVSICLVLPTLVTSHSVGSVYPFFIRFTHTCSPVSPPPDEPTTS
jgi:hypothetical protein